ncbi:hypothetical protein C8Q75DRAFT_521881 [Abortiporus biennis]|nr:hypothetical protein C8Q75DRAFT_521881 [Abortiporus biennis]
MGTRQLYSRAPRSGDTWSDGWDLHDFHFGDAGTQSPAMPNPLHSHGNLLGYHKRDSYRYPSSWHWRDLHFGDSSTLPGAHLGPLLSSSPRPHHFYDHHKRDDDVYTTFARIRFGDGPTTSGFIDSPSPLRPSLKLVGKKHGKRDFSFENFHFGDAPLAIGHALTAPVQIIRPQ